MVDTKDLTSETGVQIRQSSDQEEYQKDSAFLIDQILDERFNDLIDEGKAQKTDRKIFDDIHLDAIKRGYKILNDNTPLPISIFRNSAEITYSPIDPDDTFNDSFTYSISPKPNLDPFIQLDLLNDMKEHGIERTGQTRFWTDPYIINYLLDTGLQEQNRIFNHFSECVRVIGYLKNNIRSNFLKYIPEISTRIDNILSYSNILQDKDAQPRYLNLLMMQDEKYRNKISDLNTSTITIDQIPDESLETSVNYILNNRTSLAGLHNIFVCEHNQNNIENTLVVSLITGSNKMQNIHDLTRPLILPEELLDFYKIYDKYIQKAPYSQRMDHTALIITYIMNRYGDSIAHLFESQGISTEIGMSYINGVLLRLLNDFPIKTLSSNTNEKEILTNKEITDSFTLKQEKKARVEHHTLSDYQIDQIIKGKRFEIRTYLNPNIETTEDKTDLLKTLFEHSDMHDPELFKTFIANSLGSFWTKFDTEARLFQINTTNRYKPNFKLRMDLARSLLLLMQDNIDAPNVKSVLQNIITQKLLSSYIRKTRGYPRVAGDLSSYLHNLRCDKTLSDEEKRVKIINIASAHALLTYQESKPADKSEEERKIILSRILNRILLTDYNELQFLSKLDIERRASNIRSKKPYFLTHLLSKALLREEMNKIMDGFRNDTFVIDGRNNPIGFYKKVLQESVDSMNLDELDK